MLENNTLETVESTQTPLTKIVLASVRPKAAVWTLFEYPFPTAEVKSAQVYTWWHHEVVKIDPTNSNAQPPRDFLSLVRTL